MLDVLTFTAVYDVFTLLMNLHDFETSDAEHLSDTDDIHTTHHVYNLTETMTCTSQICLVFRPM